METNTEHVSEELYRVLFEQAAEGIFISDTQGHLLEVNPAGCELSGYSREELTHLAWSELLLAEDSGKNWLDLGEGSESQPVQSQYQLRGKNGRLFPVKIKVCRLTDSRWVALVRDIGQDKQTQDARDITERKRAEEALRRSEQKFETAFHTSPDAINLNRLSDGLYVDINEGFTRLTGYSREEVLGQSSLELTIWADPADRARLVQGLREQGQVENLEAEFRMKDGTLRTGLMSARRIEVDGEACILSITRDITERKQMEVALRESEERFRLFMDNSPTTVWIKDDQGRCVYLNRTHENRFGVQLEEWRGKTNFEVWPPELAEPLWQADQAVLAADHLLEFTEEIPLPDGSLSTWWTFKFPFQDTSGQRYVAGIGVDITERRQSEEALYLTRFSLEQVTDAIYWVDEAARIIDVNETACRMLGYSREELLQFSITDIDPEFSMEIWWERRRRLQHLGAQIFERTHRTKDGRIIPVELVANYIEFGERTLNCSFVRDISERKQAEEAQAKLEEQLRQAQKMESIGLLAGGVAHDFNNLLTVILGYSELIQAKLTPDDPLFGSIEQIRQSGKRAESLTRQLLAFSRKQMLAPIVLDLNDLVANLQKMLGRLIGEDITLITMLQPGLWSVKVDPGQIEQVIMNLAINARDAMPTGGRLTLETRNIPPQESQANPRLDLSIGPYVLLRMIDTGYGMDETTLAHIFEPFFTTKEQGKGTGLGLATVYGIIKQSGGEITVDSQPGQGAAFSLYLPALETVSTGSTAPQPEPVAQPGRETILMVEDEQGVRNLVRVALQDYGYTLLEADHGYQALALAQQQTEPIDLLLTDVVMPQMDGRELAERLRVLHPHIKVLFISGYTDDEVIRRGVQMAKVEFLPKPFSPVALAARVRALLDK